jgi:hypothetical protein
LGFSWIYSSEKRKGKKEKRQAEILKRLFDLSLEYFYGFSSLGAKVDFNKSS